MISLLLVEKLFKWLFLHIWVDICSLQLIDKLIDIKPYKQADRSKLGVAFAFKKLVELDKATYAEVSHKKRQAIDVGIF